MSGSTASQAAKLGLPACESRRPDNGVPDAHALRKVGLSGQGSP